MLYKVRLETKTTSNTTICYSYAKKFWIFTWSRRKFLMTQFQFSHDILWCFNINFDSCYVKNMPLLKYQKLCIFVFADKLLAINTKKYGNIEIYPPNNYLFKTNNKNTKKRCKICLKSTIKTPERLLWRYSGVILANFEHNSHLFLVFLLLVLNS